MTNETTRRDFLRTAGVATCLGLGGAATAAVRQTQPDQVAIPRWRGFNLTDFFQAFGQGERSAGMVSEDDLRWIRDWGFDYIRIPMDYWLWIDSDCRTTRKLDVTDVLKIDEQMLEKVDRTVELGTKYGLHVNLNFHRAPGYCINDPEREPFVLWSDKLAEDAFGLHRDVSARR